MFAVRLRSKINSDRDRLFLFFRPCCDNNSFRRKMFAVVYWLGEWRDLSWLHLTHYPSFITSFVLLYFPLARLTPSPFNLLPAAVFRSFLSRFSFKPHSIIIFSYFKTLFCIFFSPSSLLFLFLLSTFHQFSASTFFQL